MVNTSTSNSSHAGSSAVADPSVSVDAKAIRLPGLPRSPLTAEQQLEAVQRMQAQAEHRVKLGVQLYKAAEAHLAGHHEQLAALKREQGALQEKIEADVAQSFRVYDQYLSKSEEKTLARLDAVEGQIREVTEQQMTVTDRMDELIQRSESLLGQAKKYFAATAKASQSTTQAVDQAMARANEAVAIASEKPAMPDEHVVAQMVERLVAEQVKRMGVGQAKQIVVPQLSPANRLKKSGMPTNVPGSPKERVERNEHAERAKNVNPRTTTGPRLVPPAVPVQVMTSAPPTDVSDVSDVADVAEIAEVPAVSPENAGIDIAATPTAPDVVTEAVTGAKPVASQDDAMMGESSVTNPGSAEPVLYTQIIERLRQEHQAAMAKIQSDGSDQRQAG